MKKYYVVFAICFIVFSQAQIGTRIPSMRIGDTDSKWTFGGFAGLGGVFGSGAGGTTIYVIPRVGYKLSESFEAGLAGNFTWSSSKSFSSTMFGVGPFANYYLGRNFYLTGMYQHYFYNQSFKNTNTKISGDEDALYIGGGYMQSLGGKVYMQIGGMFNVLYNKDKSIFGGAFVPHIGVVVGL